MGRVNIGDELSGVVEAIGVDGDPIVKIDNGFTIIIKDEVRKVDIGDNVKFRITHFPKSNKFAFAELLN
jgi:predicted RNA-binding protein with TRAM domain